jgi:ABC-type lipoprotein release transport system permease subunit
MGKAFSWLLALRFLRARWVNFIAIGGVTIAVVALIVVIAVFSGFIGDIRTDLRRSSSDLLVTDLPPLQSYEHLLPALQGDHDVAALAPRLRYYAEFRLLNGHNLVEHSQQLDFSSLDSPFVQLLGIDPVAESQVVPLQSWLENVPRDQRPPDLDHPLTVPAQAVWEGLRRASMPAAVRPESQPGLPGILLGNQRVQFYFVEVGDPIELLSAQVKAAGPTQLVQKRFAFAGAFHSGSRMFDEGSALVPIEALRTMLGQDAADDGSIDLISDIAVRLQPGADVQQVSARLQQKVQALLPPGSKRCSVLTWEEQNAVFLGAVDVERAMMKVVMFAVMLIAAFLIYATLHMMVTQKVKDIGILSALGGAPRNIGAIFVLCGLVDGLLGCGIGSVLGVSLALHLNQVLDLLHIQLFPPNMYALKEVPVQLDAIWVVQVDVVALLLSLLVAWLPARKASRMHPVEALSYE